MKELFKGVNRRFLIPFEEETPESDEGEIEEGEEEFVDGDSDYGFEDSDTVRDGLGEGPAKGPGGRAHGKAKLVLPPDFEERKEKLEEALDREVTSHKLCENISVAKDCVKEIVKDAFLKSKELARANEKNEYTVLPLVDQKPHETEYEVKPGSMVEYMAIENSTRKELAVIKRRLFDVVTDKKCPRWIPGAEKGKRIDRRLLARIPLGERKFYKYKVESDILDLAVMLLVDESGSMSGTKAEEARRCAVMFGKLLSSVGVPSEIVGFTTTALTSEQAEKARKLTAQVTNRAYNRSENLRHNIYKRFTDNYDQVKTKLVNINAWSNNFDQDDIEWAWQRLVRYCLANNITRKVLIVISDGQPVGGVEAREKLKMVINEIGCDPNADVIGIGVQTHYVKDFYHKCVEIDNASQLGINVVKLLESAILKKKGKKSKLGKKGSSL